MHSPGQGVWLTGQLRACAQAGVVTTGNSNNGATSAPPFPRKLVAASRPRQMHKLRGCPVAECDTTHRLFYSLTNSALFTQRRSASASSFASGAHSLGLFFSK